MNTGGNSRHQWRWAWDDRLLRWLTAYRFRALSIAWRYALAVAAVPAATVLRRALLPWLGPMIPYNVWIVTAAAVTAFLGLGPGLLFVLLGAVAVEVYILGSLPTLLAAATLSRMSFMVLFVGALVCLLIHAVRIAAVKARQSAERLSTFGDATFEGIVESEAGLIVDCNQQFAEMAGRPLAQLRGMSIVDLIPREDRERVLANVEPNRESVVEHALLRPDGTQILVETHGRPLASSSTRRHTAVRDITRRKQAETALRASEERLRVARQLSPDGFSILRPVRDAGGRVVDFTWFHANPATERMVGVPFSMLEGRSLLELFPGHRGSPLFDAYCEVAETGQTRIEEAVYHGEGVLSERWFRVAVVAMVNNDIAVLSQDITARKRAEAALAASEERLRAFVTATSDVVYRMGPDWSEMWHLQGREFIPDTDGPSRTWLEKYIHPKDHPRVLDAINEAIRTKSIFQLEHQVLRVDGTLGWTFSRAVPLFDAAGEIVEWVGVAGDITERKQAEAHMAADLHAITCLQKVGSLCAGASADLGTCLEAILAAAIEITGADKGNVQLLDPVSGVLTIAAHRGFQEPFLRFFASVRDEAATCAAALRAAERVIVEDVTRSEIFVGQPALDVLLEAGVRAVQSTPLVSSTGTVLGMISTHFSAPHRPADRELRLIDVLARAAGDYLERKEYEERLGELSQRLTYHVDHSPLAVIEWGPDMRLTRWSREAERLFGWNADEVLGKRMEDFRWIHGDDRAQVADVSAELRSGADPHRFSLNRNYRKDGSVVWCEWYNSSLLDESGRLRSILSLVLDVTERKRAEEAVTRANEQLREADQRKDEYLATLGHELRNPLGAIASASRVLKHADAGEQSDERARAVIDRQVEQLSRLVDDLLDVSRITAGKIRLDRRPLDLGDVVGRAVATWRAVGRFGRHEVVFEVAPAWIEADEMRIEQILDNLVGNALKYTPPGGRVTVRVAHEGERVLLEVADTGAGIPPDLIGKVFDLFVQGDRTLDRAQGGLGIGLTLVKALVELHAGTIEARSDGRGRGTVFTVRLPSLPARFEPRPAAACTSTLGPRRRILVVEDNADAREMLRTALVIDGHEVHAAADGPTALALASDVEIDVALVDIGLPGLDGYEVARRLRRTERGKSVLLVALTGYGQAEDRERAVAAGFDAHLTKPIDPVKLLSLIGDLAEHASRIAP